jgi:hypothetical protein
VCIGALEEHAVGSCPAADTHSSALEEGVLVKHNFEEALAEADGLMASPTEAFPALNNFSGALIDYIVGTE